MQAAPGAGGEDARVDLEVEVTARVARSGGAVAYDGGLELLDRHLHLSTAGSDARSGVLGQPADDLVRGTVLRGVVRLGDHLFTKLGVRDRGQAVIFAYQSGLVEVMDRE